jgi:signal transduction histidine kinase
MQRQLERAERQRAVERERTRISQDMHDELGSKLAKISFLSELARDGRSPPGEAEGHVHAIAGTSRDVLRALDELVWAVNPKNDSLEHVAGYLCRHAREYFENTGVECEFAMPPRLPEVVMATDVRHNLILAFEEALANVLKHAAASRVSVRLSLENRRLEIVITDNGRGFRPDAAPTQIPRDPVQSGRRGHGLPNMRERLSELGGECMIESTAGEGTRVTFTLAVEMR